MKSLNKFYVSLITVLWSALSASAQVPNITSSATPADVEEGSPSASPFSYTITADNAPLAYTAANLPSWATLTGDTIEGTPQAGDVGTVEFEVYAVNADGPSAPFNVSFSVLPAGGSAPSVSPSPLPPQTGFVGNPFSYTIPFSGTPPDTVNVYYLSGFPGLTYNASLQIIEGTPTSSGPGTVIIFAENGFGSSAFSLEINILGNVPTLPSGSTYTGEQDSDFSYQIDATNSPTSYSVTGLEQIPGLQLDSTGLITGTPEKFGIFELQVYASNSEGQSAAQTLTLTINKPGGSLPIPEITSSLSILGYVGVSLPTYTILADGNPTGYSSGILPSGLSLNASGEISGIPTVAGTYFVEIGATNGAGSDSKVLEIEIRSGDAPTVSIRSPENGDSLTAGETVIIDVQAEDADGQIVSVEISDIVSGTPVSLGFAQRTGVSGLFELNYPNTVGDQGQVILVAEAEDNDGNSTTSEEVSFSLFSGAVPTVSIDSPLNGDDFFINTSIPLAITANDGDDSVVSVEVFSNGGSVGFAYLTVGATDDATGIYTGAYEFTLTQTADAGLQRLTAVATDELGNSTTSSEVNILLSSGASPVTAINEVNGAVLGEVSVDALIAGVQYEIVTEGTGTDFATLGAANSNVGTTFTSDGTAGTGTGTVRVSGAIPADLGRVVTLEISASDSDGNVSQVEVFNGVNSIGLANLVDVDTYRFDYQASSPGLLNLQVRSTDDLGNIGFSDLVPVSVITGDIPTATINNLTPGDSIKSGETLDVYVTAGDSDGFITSVEVFNNDVSLGLANPTGAVNEFLLSYRTSAADLGNLNLQARAVDNQGNVGYSPVIAYSVVQGAVPTVSIDDPLNGEVFLINTVIPLAITADDGDDSIITVEVFNGTTSVGFASSLGGNQYEFVLTETGEAGLQRLTAVATDELGNRTTSEEVNVILSNGASPVTVLDTVNGVDPTVNPVPAVDLGSVVTLEISASDSDGNVTQVEVFNGSSSIGLANLVDVDTYRFDYQASSPGLLNLQVRSTDDLGNIGFSDLVPVSVITGDIPTATINNLTPGDSIKSGETLDVYVTAGDSDGFITSVEVFNNDVSLGLANPTGAVNEFLLSYRTSAADLGNLNLQARAVDNQGNVGYSPVIAYSVVQGAVPTVSIDDPLNGEVFLINTVIPLAITADDGDDSIITVEVFNGTTSVGFASSLGGNQYEFVLTETGEAGLQRLTAVATDELGNRTTSEEVNVILSNGASPVTVLDTVNGVDPTVNPVPAVDLGSVVTLEISASDSDGNVTQVEVFNGSSSIGLANLVDVDTYRFDYQASSPGLLNLQVRSTDDLGNIGFSDLVPVSVITGDIPTATINNLTPGDSIKSGETLDVYVTAGDSDGFITSVEVFNNDVSLGLANPTGAVNEFLLSYRTSAADLGNLNLQARAVDNQGNVGYSPVIAYSVVQGAVPTVSIDDPLNGEVFLINTVIPLAITADDGDDSIITVEVFNGTTSVGFASSLGGNQYEFVLTETGEAGLQRLTAVATDELGNRTTSEEVNVILSNGASPVTVLDTVNGVDPTVNPVPAVDLGSVVTLEISASDSDGNVTQVEVFNGSSSIGLANLVDVDTYRFDYQASSPGLLNLQVRSTDDLGNIGFSDLVPVSVITGDIPTATINNLTPGDSIKSGETLDVYVTAGDSDGFITSVEVFNNDVSLGLANPTGAVNEFLLSYRTSAADLGNLNLQARAVDNQGNVGYSPVIAYSVVQGAVPTVSIDDPLNGEVFLINTVIPLAITADDGDDSIITVEVFNGTTSVGFASSLGGNQYEFVLTETGEAGLQRLTAVATDELGNRTTSEEVNVILSNGASPVTVLDTVNGVDPTVNPVPAVDLGSVVTLEISASDSDGNVTQVEVFNGSSSIGLANLVDVDTYRFDYQASSPGLLNLQVRSTDDLGNIGFSDLVPVSVITGDIPTVGITLPGEASYTVGDVIAIDVAADDADGFVTSVDIFNGDVLLGTASKVSETGYRLNLPTSLTNLGVLQLNARATDDSGNVSISTFVEAEVLTGAVPTGLIVLPGGPYYEGDMLTIDVNVNDADGYVTLVEIFNGDVSLGLASKVDDTKFRLVHGPLTPGNLQLRALVTDDRGNASVSTPLSTSVNTNTLPILSIDSPGAVSTFNYGNVIPFEITASDSDGSISSVSVSHLDNGTLEELGQALKVDSVGNDQYRFSLDTAIFPTAGTKFISVVAVDDRGNAGTELVEIRLNVVPFSVDFTSPTASPYIIEGATNEYFSAKRSFTVEIGGIDASNLSSIDWQLDGGSAALSQTLVEGSLTYSQIFEFSDTSILTVTATNTDDVSVQTSLTVFVDLPDPDADLTDFIYFIYNQVRGVAPSVEDLQTALAEIAALGGDTPANRATLATQLLPSDQYNNAQYQTVALIYKTLTGQWPTQTQLESGLDIISQDLAAQSNQTVLSLEGSIASGDTEVLSFNYSEGDQVTISATGDGTNSNPLTDAVLTIRAPDGSFVGYSDDNFLSGNFSLDPVVNFVASQTGAYTATVGGYNSLLSGDFVVTSTSTSIESNANTLAARALVESLKDTYNGSNGFLADADTDSYNLSPAFVAQIYLNKHGEGITTWNSSMLGARLTGINQDMGNGYTLPGYQNNVVNFVADFALDVDPATGPLASMSTGDGYSYSGTLYYGLSNNPLSSWDQARAEIQSDANLSFALSALLGIQNPTATDLAPYAGMALEQALASIFGSAQFAAQFPGDIASTDTDGDGFSDYEEVLLGTDPDEGSIAPTALDLQVSLYMLSLGVDDGDKVAANDDADGDGVSNYVEFLLDTDPSDGSLAPTAADSFVAQRMVDFGVVDPTMIEADDDADGDGVSNIAEILLNTNPSNINDEPTASGSSSIDGTDFVFEFVQLKSSLMPIGTSVVVECADETFTFAPVSAVDLQSNLSLSADQTGITSDYERVEYRVDTSSISCSFFRLSVQ